MREGQRPRPAAGDPQPRAPRPPARTLAAAGVTRSLSLGTLTSLLSSPPACQTPGPVQRPRNTPPEPEAPATAAAPLPAPAAQGRVTRKHHALFDPSALCLPPVAGEFLEGEDHASRPPRPLMGAAARAGAASEPGSRRPPAPAPPRPMASTPPSRPCSGRRSWSPS